MKKPVLALMVCNCLWRNVVHRAANTTTVTTAFLVNFVGQVVDAACSVSADSVDQTVTLGRVRASKLGRYGGESKKISPLNWKTAILRPARMRR